MNLKYLLCLFLVVLSSCRKDSSAQSEANIIIEDNFQSIYFDHKKTKSISVINETNNLFSFSFDLNGKAFLSDSLQLVDEILQINDDKNLGFPYQTWKYLINNSYHYIPLTREIWLHNPFVFLNSIGSGFCDDVSSVFLQIMGFKNYPARVWALNGHVVPEVFYNGKWMMFDPDLKVYYYNNKNEIASVEELEVDNSLIFNPQVRLNISDSVAYSTYLADVYSSEWDNEIASFYTKKITLSKSDLPLPKGYWTFLFDYNNKITAIDNSYIPQLNSCKLFLASGFNGPINVPLKLVNLYGEGNLSYKGKRYTVQEFKIFIDQNLNSSIYSDITDVVSQGITLEYVINPKRYNFIDSVNIFKIKGDFGRSVVIKEN